MSLSSFEQFFKRLRQDAKAHHDQHISKQLEALLVTEPSTQADEKYQDAAAPRGDVMRR
jgi:hypothetical protein